MLVLYVSQGGPIFSMYYVYNLLQCHIHILCPAIIDLWDTVNITFITLVVNKYDYCLFSNKLDIRFERNLVFTSMSHFIRVLMSFWSKSTFVFIITVVAEQLYKKCLIPATSPELHCLQSLIPSLSWIHGICNKLCT